MGKKILNLISIILMLDPDSTRGQYTPLPLDSNHYWIQYDSKWAPPNPNPNLPINTLYRISLLKDSLINNTVYHKMGKKGPSKDGMNGGFILLNAAFLREDTASKKVYYFNFSDSSDILLYDFSKSTGDTIKGMAAWATQLSPFMPPALFDMVIINTTLVLTGDGTMRKKYSLQYSGTALQANDMIEGIGSSGGLLTPNYTSESEWTSLVCHGSFQPSQSIYHFGNTQNPLGQCDYLTGMPFLNAKEEDYAVYPNPTNGSLWIKSSGEAQLRILSISGQCVFTQKLEMGESEVELHSFPLGYYLFELRCGYKSRYTKVVKVE